MGADRTLPQLPVNFGSHVSHPDGSRPLRGPGGCSPAPPSVTPSAGLLRGRHCHEGNGYTGAACKQSNSGSYSSYTLQECYEKCATRDCEAFSYQSLPGMNGENAGGNLCKVYDECGMKPGTEGEFVFFPKNNCIAEQWNGFSYKPANDGEKWYKKYDNLSTCLTRCDEGDMVTTGMEGDGNCYCWREDDGEFVRNTDDVVYQLADC